MCAKLVHYTKASGKVGEIDVQITCKFPDFKLFVSTLRIIYANIFLKNPGGNSFSERAGEIWNSDH